MITQGETVDLSISPYHPVIIAQVLVDFVEELGGMLSAYVMEELCEADATAGQKLLNCSLTVPLAS